MRKIRLLLPLILGFFLLSVNAFAAEDDWRETQEMPLHQEAAHALNNGGEASGSFTGRYYGQLNADCKTIYSAIEASVGAVLGGNSALANTESDNSGYYYYPVIIDTSSVPSVTPATYNDCCKTAFSAYLADHPREASTFDGYFDALVSQIDGNYVLYLHLYAIDDNVVDRAARLDTAVEQFHTRFSGDGMFSKSRLLQYRYIHDFLCDTCSYNHGAVNPVAYGDSGFEAYRMAHRAYGALVELEYNTGVGRGSVVCEGYAEAFQLLCQKVGLPCATVDGDGGMEGETLSNNHEWNVIQLVENGEWYAVDVTWDDSENTIGYILDGRHIGDVSAGWRYTYFADNRYFMAHDGEPKQDHQAMSQLSYAVTSDTLTLDAPTLTESYISEVNGWSSYYCAAYIDDGATTQAVNYLIGYIHDNLQEANETLLYLRGDLIADEAVQVADGAYLRLYGRVDLDNPRILREENFTGVMFDVVAGGMLDLFDLTLDGGEIAATGAMIALGAGTEEHRAIAELARCAVTGSRDAYAIAAKDCAKVYLSDSVAFSNNYIGAEEANVDLGDGASFHLNYRWDGGEVTNMSSACPWIWDDAAGVYASVLCLEKDAILFCATYTEDGRMVGVESTPFIEGFHLYTFPGHAADYGEYENIKLFVLRGGSFVPLLP